MHAHPTDPALPAFYIGTAISKPTMIIDGSTVHIVFALHDACVGFVSSITQTSSPYRSYLLLEIDELSERSVGIHWRSSHEDIFGHKHLVRLTIADDNVRYPNEDSISYSNNSFAQWGEHELAPAELERFGLSDGILAFEGTRTLRVWHVQRPEGSDALPVTCIYEQSGLHFYSWLHSLHDAIAGLFPALDGDNSVEAW